MLYVFQMDIGQMLTFDMSLLMDTVSRLQVEICKTTGIAVDHQILLLSGGQSLKPDQKVMTYGAGADTNPVFLFSKLAIESQEAPVIRSFMISKDAISALKERVTDAMKLRPSYDAVNMSAKLAVQMRDSATNIYGYCKNEFQEQHLQHQGWAAVIANLEEIADALQRTEFKFSKVFHAFFPVKDSHLRTLDGFSDILGLMGQIPLLESLKDPKEDGMDSKYKSSDSRSLGGSLQATPTTLLEWICSQAQSQGIDCLHQKCEDDLQMFNESMFESYDKQVQDLLSVVRLDPNQMKELVGIERRLSELEKRLNEAKKIATSQNDMAQGFIKHQSKIGSLPDVSSILPDLCESHKQQLLQMLESQQRMVALQNNFRNSKQEMSRNIHQRLGWVMHVETKIAKLDSELIFHIKTLKVLECNLDLLNQIKVSPHVYADLVVETARRKKFSSKYSQWADVLEGDTNRLYEAETQRRKDFSLRHGEHFLLHTLFKGFEDKPPNITTKVPRLLDAKLPEITSEEISWLKSSVPELEESLSVIDSSDEFPNDLLCTYPRDKSPTKARHTSPLLESKMSRSQAPCIVTATEGPALPFTVPDANSSKDLDTQRRDKTGEASIKRTVDKSCQEDAKEQGSKETQTSLILSPHDNKCVGTNEESESESTSKHNLAGGRPVSTVDSNSPHTSSEFATADFYFEDSMPSPMIEGSAAGGGGNSSGGGPVKSGSKEDLVNQVKEQSNTIEELSDLVKQKDEEIMRLQNDVRSLKGENSEQMEFFSLIGPLEEESEEGCVKNDSPSLNNMDVKIVESACCQTDSTVDDRVKDLEQKLEKLTSDLDQSQLSLTNAEINLQVVQEQEQTVHEKSRCLISKLQEEITERNDALEKLKIDLDTKEEEIVQLKNSLVESGNLQETTQKDLEQTHEVVKSLKMNFRESVSKIGQAVPFLKEDISSLKTSVKDHLLQLESFKSSAMSDVEKQMSSFTNLMSALDQERESLKAKVCILEGDLKGAKEESMSETSDLKSQIACLKEQLSKQEETFASKYSEQKKDFDCALEDSETKHALEMELELEKCKSEMQEIVTEWESKYSEEKDSKGNLLAECDAAKESFEKEKCEMRNDHECVLAELERKHETWRQQCDEEWKDTLEECNSQVQKLEIESAATAAANYHEMESSLESLRKHLLEEYEESVQDLRQMHKEQSQKYIKTIEDQQMNHAYKLTELKKSFDLERELIQAELKKYKESEAMIHSQTQTERELLAEVISLTSSASDGMEELTSAKSSEETETETKEMSQDQPDKDDLSKQLEKAYDAIEVLDKQVKNLLSENEELKVKLKPEEEDNGAALFISVPDNDKGQSQSMIQSYAVITDKEKTPEQSLLESTEESKMKDQKIAHLEKQIMEMSVTSMMKTQRQDKISFKGCDMGDIVLLCLDEKHDQYVVFTVGTNLHFLHSDSLEGLGLKSGDEARNRRPWILAEVLDKEYCLAKKPNNRFRVPQGTCFYRVKCQPWKCDVDLTRHKDKDKHKASKGEQVGGGAFSKSKKTENKK